MESGRYYAFGWEIVPPDRFDLYEVGDDYVLGRWRDAFDIEHVQLYDLIKPR